MKPACISDNGSAKETENAGHFRLLEHPFTSPSKMPKGSLGTEFFNQTIFLMQKQRKCLLIFQGVLDLKFFPSAREIELLQILYLEFLV